MSIEKVFRCDVGGEHRKRDELIRFGVRRINERPEDAENIDVCDEHAARPIAEMIALFRDAREESGHVA